MDEWKQIFSAIRPGCEELGKAFRKWGSLRGGKTRNVDIIWFPKPITNLNDMREKLKVALELQIKREKEEGEGYFVENEVAEELARRGAFTRPATSSEELIEEYEEEVTPNKPHISSFRMQNRLFRFLGWTTRRVGYENQYVVTDLGKQIAAFSGPFPSTIGHLSEKDLVVKSLVNFGVFSVNDNINQWDTRFKQRIVVNLLRVTAFYGYISNNELVVTAFALKDERDPEQVKKMIHRLQRLHEGKISMIDAFKEVNVDPYNSSAVNNAYDGPKVLLSLCRQVNLLHEKTIPLESSPYGDLRPLYEKMHRGKSAIKKPRVVNIITDFGRRVLEQELKKTVIWFDELK
ncbi:MAG: hypothetical protein QXN87_08095 [Candidatus Bathyarchaeia archaeon]